MSIPKPKPRVLNHPALQQRAQQEAFKAARDREFNALLLVYLAGFLPLAALLLLLTPHTLLLLGVVGGLLSAGLGLCSWLAERRARSLQPQEHDDAMSGQLASS